MFPRHVLGPVIILVRFLPALLSLPQRGDLCSYHPITQHSRIVQHVNSSSGQTFCCKQITCSAGFEVQFCTPPDVNSTRCVPCQTGYYSPDNQPSYFNPQCRPWVKCNIKLGMVFNNDGTAIYKGTCRCAVEKGWYNSKWEDECIPKSEPCQPDHELNVETGRCERCRAGYEQLRTGFGPCVPCPKNMYKGSSDSNCTQCPPGTFKKHTGYGNCQSCENLIAEGEYDSNCTPDTSPTPKVEPAKEKDDEAMSPPEMVILASVLSVILAVILIVILLIVCFRRRPKPSKSKVSSRKQKASPLHAASTPPTSHGYRAICSQSGSSTSNSGVSGDCSSHSSAEDALDMVNEKARPRTFGHNDVINEKTMAFPGHPIQKTPGALQGQPPPPPTGLGDPGGARRGPPVYVISSPQNCSIAIGHGNQLATSPPTSPPPPPAEVNMAARDADMTMNDLDRPPLEQNARQAAPPAAYFSDDEADRLEALYNGSQC